MTTARTTATWVMPHWTNDFATSRAHLEAALRSVIEQTDPDWELVVIDDGSEDRAALDYLRAIADRHPEQVHVIAEPSNRGAGAARNIGVRWAAARHSPFVVFLDADDLSRPGRLAAVRAAFDDGSAPGVVYSTFDVIDPSGRLLPLSAITGSISEVIEEHRKGPPVGPEAWVRIATETGYINHTSSTAVRTDVALAHPFPDERVSEDAHTWLRYSAGGADFVYLDAPWSAYRTTTDVAGSSSRRREGGKAGFYAAKARVDADGFRCAIGLATARGVVAPSEVPDLWVGFHVRLAVTLVREGERARALDQLAAARAVSVEATERRLTKLGWREHL